MRVPQARAPASRAPRHHGALEAMARPVCRGPSETVTAGPGLRRKLGRAARERAMAFDVEAVADRNLELYGSPGVGHA